MTAMKPIEQRTMSVRDRQKLSACETDIDKGGNLIITALATIRDERLYRDSHDTFEEYCQDRWKLSHRHVNRMIEHGRVLANLESEMGPIGPKISEAATRPIRDLPAEDQVKVVSAVVTESKKVTAKAVEEKRDELKATGKISGGITFDTDEIERSDQIQEEPAIPPLIDTVGQTVPEHLREACSNAGRLNATGRTADQLVREIEGLKGQPGAEYVTVQPLVSAVKDVKKTLIESRYWTVCPRCNGGKCQFCDDVGYLPHKRKGTLSSQDKAKLGIEE